MNTDTFYARSIRQRVKLLKRNGEPLRSIHYYGFNIDLCTMGGHFFETFYNRYTYRLDEVDIINPKAQLLYRYAVGVNLPDLFANGKGSR